MEKEAKFCDQDMINDLLHSIKNITTLFNTYHSEASSEEIVEIIDDLLLTAQDEQRYLFDFMSKKGWYKLESEDENKILQDFTKFENSLAELPNIDYN